MPEAEWIRVENTHEPIISRQDYEAVQILLKRDMRAVGKGAKSKRNGSTPKKNAGQSGEIQPDGIDNSIDRKIQFSILLTNKFGL